jgi:hypothetical protein
MRDLKKCSQKAYIWLLPCPALMTNPDFQGIIACSCEAVTYNLLYTRFPSKTSTEKDQLSHDHYA